MAAPARPCGIVRTPGVAGGLVPPVVAFSAPARPPAPGAAPLVLAHFAQCARRMPRGMVKRVPYMGPLVGYHVACPGCGFVDQWRQVDQGWIERAGMVSGAASPPTCTGCGKRILIRGQTIVAE